MSDNPLNRYFRRAALWVRLPTNGRWYRNGEITLNEHNEVRICGLSAIDDIMLNTPDALFNGHALESVIKSCVPDVNDVRSLMQPDLDAIFLGIKSATNNGKFDVDRRCPKCQHENTFEMQCVHLLDRMSYVEDADTVLRVNEDLTVHLRPYDYTMRGMVIHKQLEEQRLITEVDKGGEEIDEFQRADMMARSIERITRLTFEMVSRTITSIVIRDHRDGTGTTVTNGEHINEWLVSVDKNTADAIVEAVNRLNNIGPPKEIGIACQSCNHEWLEPINFDPALFFARR